MVDYKDVRARTRAAWRAWLVRHAAKSPGVWLIFPKKATGTPTVSYADAVEEALCFGWIDGRAVPVDDTCYKQMFTPRKPTSAWAASNRERVARMIEQGLMPPAGLAAVNTAKANGSWYRFLSAERQIVPPELTTALRANAKARAHWPLLSDSQRKSYLMHLANAKREETRTRRIKRIVEMVEAWNPPATRRLLKGRTR